MGLLFSSDSYVNEAVFKITSEWKGFCSCGECYVLYSDMIRIVKGVVVGTVIVMLPGTCCNGIHCGDWGDNVVSYE